MEHKEHTMEHKEHTKVEFEEYINPEFGPVIRYERTDIDERGLKIVGNVLKISIGGSDWFYATEDILLRMLEFLRNGNLNDISGVSLEWDKINTDLAVQYSDKILLEQVKCAKVVSGWGLIAEIIKRYSKIVEIESKGSDAT